jgi:hypothetical protein
MFLLLTPRAHFGLIDPALKFKKFFCKVSVAPNIVDTILRTVGHL